MSFTIKPTLDYITYCKGLQSEIEALKTAPANKIVNCIVEFFNNNKRKFEKTAEASIYNKTVEMINTYGKGDLALIAHSKKCLTSKIHTLGKEKIQNKTPLKKEDVISFHCKDNSKVSIKMSLLKDVPFFKEIISHGESSPEEISEELSKVFSQYAKSTFMDFTKLLKEKKPHTLAIKMKAMPTPSLIALYQLADFLNFKPLIQSCQDVIYPRLRKEPLSSLNRKISFHSYEPTRQLYITIIGERLLQNFANDSGILHLRSQEEFTALEIYKQAKRKESGTDRCFTYLKSHFENLIATNIYPEDLATLRTLLKNTQKISDDWPSSMNKTLEDVHKQVLYERHALCLVLFSYMELILRKKHPIGTIGDTLPLEPLLKIIYKISPLLKGIEKLIPLLYAVELIKSLRIDNKDEAFINIGIEFAKLGYSEEALEIHSLMRSKKSKDEYLFKIGEIMLARSTRDIQQVLSLGKNFTSSDKESFYHEMIAEMIEKMSVMVNGEKIKDFCLSLCAKNQADRSLLSEAIAGGFTALHPFHFHGKQFLEYALEFALQSEDKDQLLEWMSQEIVNRKNPIPRSYVVILEKILLNLNNQNLRKSLTVSLSEKLKKLGIQADTG